MKQSNLIIDVGMHVGQDTEFYLAKGFDVVAIEANPALVEHAQKRFEPQVASGQLRVLGVAIAEREGMLPLAVADDVTIWSSLSPRVVERNRDQSGTDYRYVDVPTRSFESIVEEVGVPRYVKVDIEGLDMLCVRALRRFAERPDFVSIESNVSSNDASFDLVFDELAELWSLGYRRFAYVNQRDNPRRRPPRPPREGRSADVTFTMEHSGLFGDELPVRWEDVGAALLRAQAIRLQHNTVGYAGRWTRTLPSRVYRGIRHRLGGLHSWYDLHARLP